MTLPIFLVSTWLLVAWGALAFGAVYPWAWRPLITGCAVVGLGSWAAASRAGGQAHDRAVLTGLAAVALAAAVQLVPVSREWRLVLSPASETLLLDQDLKYASALQEQESARPLSIDPTATSRSLLMLSGLALLLAGLTRLLNVTGARRLSAAVVALGVALALIGIVQRAVLGDHAYAGMKIYGFWTPSNLLTTPFGPYVNRNHFAGWMLMGIPLALGLGLGWAARGRHYRGNSWRDAIRWMSSEAGGKLQLAGLAAGIMAVSLLMTQSRSGLAGFLLAVSAATAVLARRSGGRSRVAAITGVALLAGSVMLLAGGAMASRIAAGGGSIELRRHIWSDSAAAIRDFPLTGTGLNTFGRAMLSYQTTWRGTPFQEAHNDYLQLVVEGGLLLALPAAAWIVALAATIRRRFVEGGDDAMTYWLRVGATCGIVAIAAQSLVEFSLQMPGNAVMCVVLLAIALHLPPARRPSRQSSPAPAPS